MFQSVFFFESWTLEEPTKETSQKAQTCPTRSVKGPNVGLMRAACHDIIPRRAGKKNTIRPPAIHVHTFGVGHRCTPSRSSRTLFWAVCGRCWSPLCGLFPSPFGLFFGVWMSAHCPPLKKAPSKGQQGPQEWPRPLPEASSTMSYLILPFVALLALFYVGFTLFDLV